MTSVGASGVEGRLGRIARIGRNVVDGRLDPLLWLEHRLQPRLRLLRLPQSLGAGAKREDVPDPERPL
jgi:hypothetical protein